jgi:predicted dehydrogenase
LMQYLSNKKFTQSTSYITNSFWKIESEDNAFAILKSKDNVVGMLHSSATQWKHKFLLEICLEDGYLNLDGILSTTRSYAPEKLIKAKREFEDITFAMGKPEETVTWFENDDSWFLEVKEFIESIEQNRKITSGTIYDAIEMLRLVGDIYNNTAFVDETE